MSAPPVEGAANDELLALVSRALDLPRRAVALVSGERGRLKRIRIEGLTAAEARTRLGIP